MNKLNLNITKLIVDGYGMTTVSAALEYVNELSECEYLITHHKLTIQEYRHTANDLLQAYRNLENLLGVDCVDQYLCRTR